MLIQLILLLLFLLKHQLSIIKMSISKTIKSLIGVVLLAFLLQGCSFVRRFRIVNNSNETIEINYTIKAPDRTFAIFTEKPDAYSLDKKEEIDWDKKLQLVDLDTSFYVVKVKLPPKSTLIIGTLNNDEYTSYNQYFINGRSFNFSQLTILKDSVSTTIVPETFDTYFTKKDGDIIYVLK